MITFISESLFSDDDHYRLDQSTSRYYHVNMIYHVHNNLVSLITIREKVILEELNKLDNVQTL